MFTDPYSYVSIQQTVCNRMLVVTIDFPPRQTQVLPFPLICFLYSCQFWKRLNKVDHFMKTILNSDISFCSDSFNKLFKWIEIV